MDHAIDEKTPRARSRWLIRRAALTEVAQHTSVAENLTVDQAVYDGLDVIVASWCADDLLLETVSLAEWLATELLAYQQVAGGQVGTQRWLIEFGDEVCLAQRHAHPAGPTAIQILSVVAEARGRGSSGDEIADHLRLLAAPILAYVRPGHAVADARELLLTLALWAGAGLAGIMEHDPIRITAYLDDSAQPR